MNSTMEKNPRGGMGWIIGLGIGCGLILLFPVLPPSPLSSSLHALFSRLCHQAPDRSFAWGGKTLPVCVRCTGLYGGAFLGALFGPWVMSRRARRVPWKFLLGSIIVLNLIEHLFEGFWRNPTPWPRLLTGTLLGGVLGLCLIEGWREQRPREVNQGNAIPLQKRLGHWSIPMIGKGNSHVI